MESIGLWGFALASLGYLVFALLIFAARNKTLIARWLLWCALLSCVASAVNAAQVHLGFSLRYAMLFDTVKIAAWSVLILSFHCELESIKNLLKLDTVKRYLAIWGILVLSYVLGNQFLGYSTKYLFLLFIILNLWSLVLLEQLYRSADAQVKRAIWPLIIGLGSVAVFDFVLFAQATMVDALDFNFWYSRGYIAAVIIPLLLISTRRVKNGAVRVFVSRNVVFYSSMLMIAGLYLLVMALSGYLINYFGGKWGDIISVAFLVLGGIVLAVLLITETIRRKIKVFIAKNFFANKYEYRDEWLDLIGTIETSNSDNYYQMATQIMMSKVESSGGALIKQVGTEQFKVQYQENVDISDKLNEDFTLLSIFWQSQGWIIDIEEYAQDPQAYPSLFIQPAPWKAAELRFIIPIFIGKAFYGFFVLKANEETKALNWEDRDLLFAVSKQLGNFVSLHEANDKIAESKQFDAFNRMSAFLVHDLKNVQAQLALINTNAQKHRNNPEFVDDVFETVESATERLDKMLSQLRNKQAAQSKQKQVHLAELITGVVTQANVRTPKVEFTLISDCSTVIEHETLSVVLGHLVQNAQEATSNGEAITITLEQQLNKAVISIKDNGSGMSESFIKNRLFKAFDTTKGNAGMGIGVFEAKQFIESVAGSIKVDSIEGHGTTFIIEIPLGQ